MEETGENLFEKARFLGIEPEGDSAEEKLRSIAVKVGLPNNFNYQDLSKKLDDMYKNKLNNQDNDLNKYKNYIKNNPTSNELKNSELKNNIQNNELKKNQSKNNLKNSSKLNLPQQNNQYQRAQTQKKQNEELINRIEKTRQVNNYNQYLSNSQKESQKEKLAKKGLQALGVPKILTNFLSKSESNGGTPNISSVMIKMSAPIMISILGFGILILITVISIVGLVNEDDVSELNSNKTVQQYVMNDSITDQDLTEQLVDLGLCPKNQDINEQVSECMESNPGKFFIHAKELYKSYQNYQDINGEAIKLDIPLILETISYNRTDSELFDDETFDDVLQELDDLAEAMVEKYQEVGDLFYRKSSNINQCIVEKNKVVTGANGQTVYYRISDDKYVSYLKYGKVHENYLDKTKIYNTDIHPNSDSNCIPNGRMYQSSDVIRYSGN